MPGIVPAAESVSWPHRNHDGKWRRSWFATGILALAAAVQAAPPDAVMLAHACSGCHGDRGVSVGLNMPSLAGQRKEYFVMAMKGFRSGERPATVMDRLAKGYSDTEIEAMGDYFAAQPPVRQNSPVDAKLVEKGKTVYTKQCKYCHLDNSRLWGLMHIRGEYDRQCRRCHAASGPDAKDDVPVIAGQWRDYLAIQMQDFKSGRRKMAENKAQKVNALSREDLEAVVHFCASETAE